MVVEVDGDVREFAVRVLAMFPVVLNVPEGVGDCGRLWEIVESYKKLCEGGNSLLGLGRSTRNISIDQLIELLRTKRGDELKRSAQEGLGDGEGIVGGHCD